jgi:hypothetical protein
LSDSIDYTIVHNGSVEISVLTTSETIIVDPPDVLDILAGAPSTHVVLQAQNLAPDFYDLRTRKLGEMLQKCVNFRMRLAVIGNFEEYPSKALHQFILESNRHGDYPFTATVDEALALWAR